MNNSLKSLYSVFHLWLGIYRCEVPIAVTLGFSTALFKNQPLNLLTSALFKNLFQVDFFELRFRQNPHFLDMCSDWYLLLVTTLSLWLSFPPSLLHFLANLLSFPSPSTMGQVPNI